MDTAGQKESNLMHIGNMCIKSGIYVANRLKKNSGLSDRVALKRSSLYSWWPLLFVFIILVTVSMEWWGVRWAPLMNILKLLETGCYHYCMTTIFWLCAVSLSQDDLHLISPSFSLFLFLLCTCSLAEFSYNKAVNVKCSSCHNITWLHIILTFVGFLLSHYNC